MRVWFNKTFSTIGAVFRNFREAVPASDITLICTHTHMTATAFLAADESYLEPSDLSGQSYIEWCLDFCRRHNIDLFWPGKEAALTAKNKALFEAAGTQVLSVADYETLNLLHNKAHFYSGLSPEIAKTMDFIAVDNRDAFDKAVAELSIKHQRLCVKPAVSVYGLGFRILDRQRDSIIHLLKGVEYQIPLQELRQGMDNTPHFDTLLVMEHLGGPEWSVDCAGCHGELLCAVQRKKSPHAGHGQMIGNNAEIAGMVERLASHYRLNGLFNIQFKEGEHGPRLLEINPRPSGGFGMACLSGANLAQIAWRGIKGEKPGQPVIRYGLRVSEINQPVVLQD
jgi:hypothetical protein